MIVRVLRGWVTGRIERVNCLLVAAAPHIRLSHVPHQCSQAPFHFVLSHSKLRAQHLEVEEGGGGGGGWRGGKERVCERV